MSKTILFLVKIFDEEQYALDFMEGKLFCNRLSYFRNLEENKESNRGDEHEGVVTWLQPEQAELKINGELITELAGPISVKMNWHDNLNVFCIYAGHSGDFTTFTQNNLPNFRKQLEIPEDCLNLGKYAVVVTNFPKFIDRVRHAVLDKGFGLNNGLVEYYDPNTFSGSFEETKAVFKKRDEFNHQKEYRLVFNTGIAGEEPLLLDIGDLTDITTMCTVADVNRSLEIKLPAESGSEIV